ncbi:uncharacterized protein LOC26527018 [Drosophila erecta]|uniref:Uncharacterized protein n=1 Tax=Drosophila erecta TaxID=7220 RepID=A0A0Q5WA66_DROER|nr:uncharacterized protein LOC26527018 [Drosophila erecta]KQS70355.1 uncharacterized protein Dere_GG27194 [Drosophila erecta]
MEQLVELGDPYIYMVGIPAELHLHWTYIADFLRPAENRPQHIEPNVEIVPLSHWQPREETADFEVVPLPQEPSIDLSAAGDGVHVTPRIDDNERPVVIIFRPKRNAIPWLSLKRLMPVIVAISSILFKKILSLFGINLNQVFALGLSYNIHLAIFQCFIECLTSY